MSILTAQLDYFKPSGKWYSHAETEVTSETPLHKVWEEVRALRDMGRLPGLCNSHSPDYFVLVNVPGHPHEHPHLIV